MSFSQCGWLIDSVAESSSVSAHLCWRTQRDLSIYLPRKLIGAVTGFASVACILFTEALLQWKYQGTSYKPGNDACILFIFLFIAFFQVRICPLKSFEIPLKHSKCLDAPAFVWSAEIFPTNIRSKGVSLAIFSYFVGTITFSTPAPVALQSMYVYFNLNEW